MLLLDILEKFCYKPQTIPAGTLLVKEGTVETSTYVLISGTLEVTAGNVEIGKFRRPGDTFGEMSAIMNEEASASVLTETECKVYVIQDLKTFLIKNPELAIDMLKKSYARLKQMNKGVNFMLSLIP
ncbi:MAG: cyclic nucleotide-binding domain-containing protein [Lentisphaeraceae bacterium]|nr:cyclic nucleotide-binding domain-containing protein [Lentisphaeraceae bacterium]